MRRQGETLSATASAVGPLSRALALALPLSVAQGALTPDQCQLIQHLIARYR
jgi:hypothetical protein